MADKNPDENLAVLRGVKMPLLRYMLLGLLLPLFVMAETVQIGNEVSIGGVRTNYLTGYGIVVGLGGSGDGTTSRFTLLSIANMLKKMGVFIDPGQVRTKNAAAVMITANMPYFAKSGMRFDVTVSSMGDAKNIGNGVLIRTPLMGPDNNVYAFAQGSVSTGGGFSESNKGGKAQKNFSTTGVVINGAMMERDLPYSFEAQNGVDLMLKHPDFTKATDIEAAINTFAGAAVAAAVDSATVKLTFPDDADKVQMISQIMHLSLESHSEPTIVIYERTGTVIMSGDIRIDTPVYVSHGNIYVSVVKTPEVSQPEAPLSGGQTVETENVQTTVREETGRIFSLNSPSLKDLVKALNDLGTSPRDLIAILQAIKNSGKLHAKIIVM